MNVDSKSLYMIEGNELKYYNRIYNIDILTDNSIHECQFNRLGLEVHKDTNSFHNLNIFIHSTIYNRTVAELSKVGYVFIDIKLIDDMKSNVTNFEYKAFLLAKELFEISSKHVDIKHIKGIDIQSNHFNYIACKSEYNLVKIE